MPLAKTTSWDSYPILRGIRSGGSGSHRRGRVPALVTWVAVPFAGLVRGLAASMDVGAAAPDMVAECRLRLLG